MPQEIEVRVLQPTSAGFTQRSAAGHPVVKAVELLTWSKLVHGSSEARRLIQGGGVYVGEPQDRVTAHDQPIEVTPNLLVRSGKKLIVRVRAE